MLFTKQLLLFFMLYPNYFPILLKKTEKFEDFKQQASSFCANF